MLERFLERVYVYKKAVASAIAAAYSIYALADGGFTQDEALAAQAIVFGVIAVYLAANEYPEEV